MFYNLDLKVVKQEANNKVISEVGKIIKSLSSRDYMGALKDLDLLCELNISDIPYFVRATIRNLVMDLNGSLSDLDKLSVDTDDSTLLKATILSKMGKLDESISIIRKLGSNKGIGIAGRRMDLSLIGIVDGYVPDHIIAGWEVGTIAGHLLALAEWKQLEKAFKFLDVTDSKEYAQIFKDLRKCGALFEIGPSIGVSEEIKGIMGWFSPDEIEYLASLAKKVPADGKIVEIGSFCGRSTISLILGSQKGKKPMVHSVDTHLSLMSIYPEETLTLFIKNLQKRNLLDYVTIHRYKSEDLARMWDEGGIALLFIDADHSYESVNKDFNSWRKYLIGGALVAFHDYPQEGPNKLIREILSNNPEFFPHSFMDNLFVFEYRPHNVIVDLARNAAFLEFLELMGRGYSYWIQREETKSVEKSIKTLEKFLKEVDRT